VVLKWGYSVPQGIIWQYLETFLVVTTAGEEGGAVFLVEARDVTKHPIMHRTGLHNKEPPGPKC